MDTHRQTHTISPRSQTKYQMLQAITDSNFNSINLSIIEEEMFQIFFFWVKWENMKYILYTTNASSNYLHPTLCL